MQNTRGFRTAIIFAIIACAAAGASMAHPSIDIVASNWRFTPNAITVPLGEPTTLRLTSSGGVHGIKSDELGIADTMILPNRFATVAFTPKKAGTYVVHCSVICGAGHPNMTLTIKVQK
jgi:cytochrome c oxidase subunit 2